MRELLCNFLYLFINSFICYFFWRDAWLSSTHTLRESLEKSQPTYALQIFKSLCQKIYLSIQKKILFFKLDVQSPSKIINNNNLESGWFTLFFFDYIYIFWFLFLGGLWLFFSRFLETLF